MKGAHVWVVGSGGREHALVWKLAQSPRVAKVTSVPGNDAFQLGWPRPEVEYARVPAKLGDGPAEFRRLARLAREMGTDLVVVGPDNALADGIVDVFSAEGVLCFGPTAAAARLEASKAFAKDVMRAAGVPTARFQVAHSLAEARAFLEREPWGAGWVVKADGLALGKGVVVAESLAQALAAAESLLAVSGQLVIEERLTGEEISWLALCDGQRAALFEPARDHKRVGDGDTGPNTGGMGAYSPVGGVSAQLEDRVRRQVFEPVLREMSRRGTAFRGVLYAGLMWDRVRDQFWVLEFNARFGDPETQVLLPRMQGDLYEWCCAAAEGKLSEMPASVPMVREAAVVVVAAASGYPEAPRKGDVVEGLGDGRGFFLAGLALKNGHLKNGDGPPGTGAAWLTAGGRVLGAWALGTDLAAARAAAYERLRSIRFSGMHFRKDIGGKG